jgi:hypothetical protein
MIEAIPDEERFGMTSISFERGRVWKIDGQNDITQRDDGFILVDASEPRVNRRGLDLTILRDKINQDEIWTSGIELPWDKRIVPMACNSDPRLDGQGTR